MAISPHFHRDHLIPGIDSAAAADVSYVYDDLGRLRAVVDPATDTAVYNYDAVGNLLSISRQTSSAVSIIEFTPKAGSIGTTVTIYGTGFSTTPSQNTVAFNGLTASVVSASSTKIVTSVPAGATTGSISVTSPSGSATSNQVFTLENTGAPTITGFTPSIAVPGTSITVSGTNFNTVSGKNQLRFNITPAPVATGTSTSISASIPAGATSGRISVATQYGKALSNNDLFVPPAPYGVADVAFTGRMAIGGADFTATVNTANKIALVVFDGTQGQGVALSAGDVTTSASTVTTYAPSGSVISSKSVGATGQFIDFLVLPATGTYTILVDPSGTATGSTTLRLGLDTSVVTASPSSVVAGGIVTATWSGIASPTATDWIGLFVPGASDTSYPTWRYTTGTASGNVPFTIPATLAPGTYELRLFTNFTYIRLATSNSFTVTALPQASLSVSPSSVVVGGIVTATWSDIATPTATDWIGLFVPGASDTSYPTWRYTTGTASGNVPFTIPDTLAPGTYELRLFTNFTYGRIGKSNSFTVTAPPQASLSASPSSVVVGGIVTATWSDIASPTASDWIGLFVPGTPDHYTSNISWRYTTGTASGNVPFTIPATLAPGTYELRLFTNFTYVRIGKSNSFTVTTQASLSVSPSSVVAGGIVTATWSDIASPTASDWIGLFVPGASDTSYPTWRYTTGTASGNVPFTIPVTIAPGTYELRLFTNFTFTRLATSNSFVVDAPPPPTLSVSPSSVVAGENVTATWNNVITPTASDWIGLFVPGASDTSYPTWRYTTGTASGNVPFTIPVTIAPGTYELRLFTNFTFTRLATSNSFVVNSP